MNDIVSEGRRDINNITRSATLFLYKNIFSLLLAVFSIVTAFVYPLKATQVSLISMFNIGLPAFLLAFEPNEQKQEGRFIKEVLLKALPAALTSFFAIAAMMSFAGLFDISSTDVASASTYLLAAVGVLILYGITFPHNRYRVGVIALCILGFAATSWFGWSIFDIRALSPRAFALCVIFGFAETGVLDSLTLVNLWLRTRLDQEK
jgi:cation-transporting ATPase E